MTQEQTLELLLSRGIVGTEQKTVRVTVSDERGTPLGNGACKAVILRFNEFERNGAIAVTPTHLYYGDSQSAERELKRGETSDIIFCNDLNEITARVPTVSRADATLQILIYK